MLEIPREHFVPEVKRATAYMDENLCVDDDRSGEAGRILLAPRVLAKLIQHLEVGDGDLLLDIGCATGYSTAILAQLAQTVEDAEVRGRIAGDFAEGTAALERAVADGSVDAYFLPPEEWGGAEDAQAAAQADAEEPWLELEE